MRNWKDWEGRRRNVRRTVWRPEKAGDQSTGDGSWKNEWNVNSKRFYSEANRLHLTIQHTWQFRNLPKQGSLSLLSPLCNPSHTPRADPTLHLQPPRAPCASHVWQPQRGPYTPPSHTVPTATASHTQHAHHSTLLPTSSHWLPGFPGHLPNLRHILDKNIFWVYNPL